MADFEYIQPLNKEKLISYYRKADIYVMPSHKETFGLVYAEAMSQGLPVLYSRGQGFDRQFAEGIIGFSVDSHSPKEVAEKIIAAYDQRERIQRNSIQNVDRFCWFSICKKYVELYSAILNHSGSF